MLCTIGFLGKLIRFIFGGDRMVFTATVTQRMSAYRVIVGGLYRHSGTHNMYRVTGMARDSLDAGQHVVLYEQLFESRERVTQVPLPSGTVWTRTLESFVSRDKAGAQRFQLLYQPCDRSRAE